MAGKGWMKWGCGLVLALGALSAQADATYCSQTGGASAGPGSMTYGVNPAAGTALYADCYALVGGNDVESINGLGLSWGSDWTLAAKDDIGSSGSDVSRTVLGITFRLASSAGTAGSWTLTGSGAGLSSTSLRLDLVGAVKSSSGYGLFFFDDVLFDGSSGGTWSTPALNSNGRPQDLSHLSLYVRAGSDPIMGQPTNGPQTVLTAGPASGGAAGVLPEPGSAALLAAGLAGLALTRRRPAARG